MSKFTKSALVIVAAAASVLVTGCSKTLDFRNADISSGKIYSTGENVGFSGKVTNVPLNKLPIAGIGRIVKVVTSVTKDSSLSDLLIGNAMAGMFGKGDGGVLCDTSADDGVVNGDTLCKIASTGNPLLKFVFKHGTLDGKLTIYAAKNSGATIVDAVYGDGLLNGPSKIYSASTGKAIHSVAWEKGVSAGTEEIFDESTGTLMFTANIVNGQYDGEAKTYSADGKLISTTKWKNGAAQSSGPAPVMSNPAEINACIDQWVTAFRKEKGDDAMIAEDQTEEWRGWCKQGKKPATP